VLKMLRHTVKEVLYLLPDELFVALFFVYKLGYVPHLRKPRSFNEKLQWIKLHDRSPLRTLAVDRFKVREYVALRAPECRLVPHLWVGDDLSDTIWLSLPDSFVLKATHGSGFVFLCRSKGKEDFETVRHETLRWLATDYSRNRREWPYRDLARLLIAEEFLFDRNNKVPTDFKFFCSNGRVTFVQVDLDRFEHHTRNLYARDFSKLDVTYLYSRGAGVDRPARFGDAVAIAEKLAAPFDFIRVDLYLLGDAVYFGELTCFPEAGFGRFTPKDFDFALGQDLEIAGYAGQPPVANR
jgi:hypothetical protein